MVETDKFGKPPRCISTICPRRIACARQSREDAFEYSATKVWDYEGSDTVDCNHFHLRRKLGGSSNTDIALRQSYRRRHNAHAPMRDGYPGAEHLFQQVLGPSKGRRNRVARSEPNGDQVSGTASAISGVGVAIKKPDLMVKRHIKHGRNINTDIDIDIDKD